MCVCVCECECVCVLCVSVCVFPNKGQGNVVLVWLHMINLVLAAEFFCWAKKKLGLVYSGERVFHSPSPRRRVGT